MLRPWPLAKGQSQRFYSGVEIFDWYHWYYLSSPPQILRFPGLHLETRGLIYALNLPYVHVYCYCYVYTRTCATAKLQATGIEATDGGRHDTAGQTKLLPHYNYTTVGSKRHQGHRRTHGGIERDTRRTGGHTGDARGTRTGGNGGVGAGRKATGIQQHNFSFAFFGLVNKS
jgi:hypothetical protein